MNSDTCKGRNCTAINGEPHSDDCKREYLEEANPNMAVIRKAIERYCEEVRDPRKGYMITNAADMMEWLLKYNDKDYCEAAPEIFAGTLDDLNRLSV